MKSKRLFVTALVGMLAVNTFASSYIVSKFILKTRITAIGSSIFIDEETGVNYIVHDKGGICVRVDKDGKPVLN